MRDNGNYTAFRIGPKSPRHTRQNAATAELVNMLRDVDQTQHSSNRPGSPPIRARRACALTAPSTAPNCAAGANTCPGRRYTAPRPRGQHIKTTGQHAPDPPVYGVPSIPTRPAATTRRHRRPRHPPPPVQSHALLGSPGSRLPCQFRQTEVCRVEPTPAHRACPPPGATSPRSAPTSLQSQHGNPTSPAQAQRSPRQGSRL